jgi:formylglycine-generating enzyme required for sulfatase activity
MHAPSRAAAPYVLPALLALASTALQTAAQTPQAAPANDLKGLPTFLLPVPGGRTTVGLTTEQLVQAVCEALNPRRPELAPRDAGAVRKLLGNTASELGKDQVDVPSFLLGKWPVTNKEYEVFVKKMGAIGTKVKPPFHWWRYGRKDDYDKRLEDINREFKADGKFGPILFWARHGEDFPYKLVDEFDKPIEDHPVVFVSYRDAVRFAGWIGMRLPTEFEWTRAARGDGGNVWPWGNDKELGDKYSEAILEKLQLAVGKDRKLKPVGSVQFATGPYGHFDMVGQVWEYTSGRGFRPLTGYKTFDEEWKRLQKDKVGQLLPAPRGWQDGQVVVKGGSYLSAGDAIQFHIDCRTNLETDNPLDSVGIRLAKSLKPGYDMLFSLVTTDHNRDLFANEQEPDLGQQIGIERYVLDPSGFPDEYHALSFAPVNFLSAEKGVQVQKLQDRSQTQPLLVGTLATTEKLLQPALQPGLYGLTFRESGVPKELTTAIHVGYKEVQAALKRKEKGGEEEAKPEEAKEKNDWRAVLARFGLTEKDLEPKDSKDSLKIVRISGYEVPTDSNVFLFYDNAGKPVAHLPTHASIGNATVAHLELLFGAGQTADKTERAQVELKIRVPLQQGQKRCAEFKLELLLDQPPPAQEQNWRLPTVGAANGAPAAPAAGSVRSQGR